MGGIADEFIEEDEGLADRGFSRCNQKFPLHFPRSILRVDANVSRKITRFRGIIERCFGRLKQFKILRYTIDSNWIPKLHDLIRALAAIVNAFFPKIHADSSDFDEKVAERLLQRQDIENDLAQVHNSTRGWQVKSISQVVGMAPLNIDDSKIKHWACGTYASKLAVPYLKYAQADGNSNLKFSTNNAAPNVLRIQNILSRFSSCTNPKKHSVYLHFGSPNKTENISSYCTCKSGARTVSGCVHSVAVLTFLQQEMHDRILSALRTLQERLRPEVLVRTISRSRQRCAVDKAKNLVNLYPWKKARVDRTTPTVTQATKRMMMMSPWVVMKMDE
eukprot:TRINITY_DN277_c0_g1_i4.p1 TRINITY_DN277_c0_g1~~TRINITY_DN277_c0_g1_i4.p1  ORF type:complete len:333 (-),score=71.59 TRINITY_DN277_c0_g1_i4:1529-2527(-)